MVTEKLTIEKQERENNLTISTKLSTDRLICKTPQNISPAASVRSLKEISIKNERKNTSTHLAVYLGLLQIFFGFLMVLCGIFVLVHQASLSQIGAGIWGGWLALATGLLGVFSTARDCCPLKNNLQRLILTTFLALSLVSLAVSNLVLVLAAIGLARDSSKNEDILEIDEISNDKEEYLENLQINYSALISGSSLLVVSACECIVAAWSSYHLSRILCPCFKSPTDLDCAECGSTLYGPTQAKDILVSNWLGKQPALPPPQPVYVVRTNSTKISPVSVAPIYSLPSPPSSLIGPRVMGYPLIPAPLGTTLPPVIRHTHQPEKVHRKRSRYLHDRQPRNIAVPQQKQKKPKKTREKEKPISTEEVAKTYTGLDRVIAEEFIEICDSARNTSESDISGCTTIDGTSNEFSQK